MRHGRWLAWAWTEGLPSEPGRVRALRVGFLLGAPPVAGLLGPAPRHARRRGSFRQPAWLPRRRGRSPDNPSLPLTQDTRSRMDGKWPQGETTTQTALPPALAR